MKRGFVFFVLLLFFVSFLSSYNSDSGIFIADGENRINLNLTNAIYAKDLIKLNPDLEVVSYFDGEKERVYINVFSGIGENFLISNQELKIFSGKNTTLVLPL